MIQALRLTTALAAALAVSACVGGPAEGTGPVPLTPTSRYALAVAPGVEQVALAVHEAGLSPNQQAALHQFGGQFRAEGAPVIRIEAPSGGDPDATAQAWNVKTALEAAGAPAHMIQVLTYVAPDPRAPVLVGFDTVRAQVPQCGAEWGNLSRSFNNVTASNFGCAVNANLAAQIENPRDIVQPRGMAPVDASRRSVVFDLYRQGEQTAAVHEPLVSGRRVSEAVE